MMKQDNDDENILFVFNFLERRPHAGRQESSLVKQLNVLVFLYIQ